MPVPTPEPLPPLPAITVDVARDAGDEARASGGFLNVRRLSLVARYPDGTASSPFSYDVGARAALDAAVMAVHYVEAGVRRVYLRSAVRPPCALRPVAPKHDGLLWELPAGLVEPGEDAAAAAAREIEEELGFHVEVAAMRPLGPWTFPSGGIIGERHLFFHVEVDPKTRRTPSEDGSALERGAAIVALPVTDVIAHARAGLVPDAKTEIGVRRLAEIFP